MGQRTILPARSEGIDRAEFSGAPGLRLSVFPTALGWMGLLGCDGQVIGLTFGHATADELREDAAGRFRSLRAENESALDESDWNPDLRLRLQKFAEGQPIDFDDVNVLFPSMTAFQRRVIDATRKLGFGETVSYAELARRAGSPGAARAVGNVMKSNPIPLIIPCHRVVGSNGLGGYSAAQGVELKKSLLEREAAPPPEPEDRPATTKKRRKG